MNQVNESWLYQANFPKSKQGLTASIYYTVFNNSGSIIINRTNANVVELGDGAYGVNLLFADEGSYSIFWEIDGTPYVANEDILIFDFKNVTVSLPDVYTGYGI